MPIDSNAFPTDDAVPYGGVRDTLASGDLLLCSGRRPFSRFIRRFTDSVWSHVAFVMRLDAIDRVMVFESVESVGVRTVPLSKYLSDYDSRGNSYPGGVVVARHNDFPALADENELLSRFGQFAVDLFGYPYDRNEIISIAARIAFGADLDAGGDREYICSEYVHECYERVGVEIAYNDAGYITPADFARAEGVQLLAVLQSPGGD